MMTAELAVPRPGCFDVSLSVATSNPPAASSSLQVQHDYKVKFAEAKRSL